MLLKPVLPMALFEAVQRVLAQPATTPQTAPFSPAADAVQLPLAGLRLLVVEDHPINRQVAQELLTHAGAQVQLAADGQQGIAAVRAGGGAFDAVLMDLQMPVLDGLSAARMLRAQGFTLPIIAMTANVSVEDREAALAAGMSDHLSKPIDSALLIACLRRHCRPGSGRFDMAAALQRLGGNPDLHARLVGRFVREHEAMLARASQALDRGDREAAARELHTLKGLAATLGADGLADLAAHVERTLKGTDEIDLARQRLDELRRALPDVVRALSARAEAVAPDTAVPQGGGPPTMFEPVSRSPEELASLRALLASMLPLLAQRNLRALDIHARLRQVVDGLSDPVLDALDRSIESLDFACAAEQVRTLLDRLTNCAPHAAS